MRRAIERYGLSDQIKGVVIIKVAANSPAAEKKDRISQSTLCTGLREKIVIIAEAISTAEKR